MLLVNILGLKKKNDGNKQKKSKTVCSSIRPSVNRHKSGLRRNLVYGYRRTLKGEK